MFWIAVHHSCLYLCVLMWMLKSICKNTTFCVGLFTNSLYFYYIEHWDIYSGVRNLHQAFDIYAFDVVKKLQMDCNLIGHFLVMVGKKCRSFLQFSKVQILRCTVLQYVNLANFSFVEGKFQKVYLFKSTKHRFCYFCRKRLI